MDVSTISQLNEVSRYKTNMPNIVPNETNNASFETLFQSIASMVKETNDLTNAASEEEIKYTLGLSENVHDLQTAQKKASSSLQYTVAVRNSLLDAYKEIMNLQF